MHVFHWKKDKSAILAQTVCRTMIQYRDPSPLHDISVSGCKTRKISYKVERVQISKCVSLVNKIQRYIPKPKHITSAANI